MDTAKFEEAQRAYDAKEYSAALSMFLQYAKDSSLRLEPGDKGYLYHMMGNCLVKMRRFDKAISAYERALKASDYGHAAALNVNLGIALSATRRYDEAISCFQKALDDDEYETPYKAYVAMGNALLRLNRPADAGVVFRKAALEENNPDPGRSLVNLGVCFMALNRPHDAVESYVAALDFDNTPEATNKTHANLGQAYVATGRMSEAVQAFENALKDGTYELSESAQTDYDRAKTVVDMEANPAAGLDTYGSGDYVEQPLNNETAVIPSPDDTGFFTVTEEQLEQEAQSAKEASKRMKKVKKKGKHRGLKVFLVIVIILVILLAAGAFAYVRGYGWPMQETVVTELFQANANGDDVSQYWNTSDSSEIKTAMNGVSKNDDITIDSVDRGMMESTAVVTQNLDGGGTVRYRVALTRSGIGWKVASIDFDFASYPF
jgi:tetratricopeptide (TPR) repeat protein